MVRASLGIFLREAELPYSPGASHESGSALWADSDEAGEEFVINIAVAQRGAVAIGKEPGCGRLFGVWRGQGSCG